MDSGDSCVLTYVSHECGCKHRSYIYREGEPCLCEQHCKDGSDTYCQDKLEYGISIHICVALMLFLILHQQAVILVCCCIKKAMLFNQSFSKRSAYQASKDETEGSCGCTDGRGTLYVQVL